MRTRARWLLGLIALLLFACALALLAWGGSPGWGHYHAAAPPGIEEIAVRQQFLAQGAEQPPRPEKRFKALFAYFARGFLRHANSNFSRVQYGGAGSKYGYDMSGLEGFARTAPLLAAWVYGGRPRTLESPGDPHTDFIDAIRSGMLAGMNPDSGSYWGDAHDYDQRLVEAADIARVLWLTRADIWQHLNDGERSFICRWLLAAAAVKTPGNNWELFPVVIDLLVAGLDPQSQARFGLTARAHAAFGRYRRLYARNGWFHDSPRGTDFYNVWGITYDLFWIHQLDPTFETDFIVSALHESAELTAHLISPQGVPIIGRSVCYRTSVPVPLIARSLLIDDEVETGRALRALDVVWRYFIEHGSLREGALSQGYFDSDMRFLDDYSGPGSCHWGLRSLVLAFMHPRNDRFWSAQPRPLPVEEADFRLELPELGWTVVGQRASSEISVEIDSNPPGIVHAYPYSPHNRVWEILRRRPYRPVNDEVKYESRRYSSATPFPAEAP